MRKAVLDAFATWVSDFEGRCNFMYCDVKRLVTTGIGNLIDPVEYAVRLPWRHQDGRMATRAEIEASWRAVKGSRIDPLGGGGGYAKETTIRLSEADVDALVRVKLLQQWGELRKRFPQVDTWCADGQLGVASWAWAAGPWARFPNFAEAARKSPPDYTTMAVECKMRELNESARLRNIANRDLFLTAAKVTKNGYSPEVLWSLQKQSKCPTCGQATA